jgi:hypothetical protein
MDGRTYYVVTSIQFSGIFDTFGDKRFQYIGYQHAFLSSIAHTTNTVAEVVMETIHGGLRL